jgi:predicted HTH domain antitoxin
MTVTLELPDLLISGAGKPERGVLEAVAIRAYGERRISEGKLAELLGLNHWETEELLNRCGVSRPYRSEDFDRELENLSRIK